MFMCKHCLEQYEDKDLAYTLIPEKRRSHPMADAFVLKFCSKAHVQQFLEDISHHSQVFILTKVDPSGNNKEFEPNAALDLLLLVGSSKG
ncbi:MAG TPA: hypothetical protein VD902_11500 [Symbiobacteriaceae bacterium]|nr:hypothetical protein [Symbiobacteriaceae bacterium]